MPSDVSRPTELRIIDITRTSRERTERQESNRNVYRELPENALGKTRNGTSTPAHEAIKTTGRAGKHQDGSATPALGPGKTLVTAHTTLVRTRSALAELEQALGALAPDVLRVKGELDEIRKRRDQLRAQLEDSQKQYKIIKKQYEATARQLEREQARLAREGAKLEEARRLVALREFAHRHRKNELDYYKKRLSHPLLYPVHLIVRRRWVKERKKLAKLIERSGLFDSAYYKKQCPDAGNDPITHYLRVGALAAANPSSKFDTAGYLVANPDARRQGTNPLVDFLTKTPAIGNEKKVSPRSARENDSSGAAKSPQALGANSAACARTEVTAATASPGVEPPQVLPDLDEQARLIRSGKHIHTRWYSKTYPDVKESGLDPAMHYLQIGAAKGYRPRHDFDTLFYERNHPEVSESDLNPLVHYVLYGQAKGYRTQSSEQASKGGMRRVNTARKKLLSLGFTERPLQELEDILLHDKSAQVRALAARELATWHMRAEGAQDYRVALSYIEKARKQRPDLDLRRELAVAELICYYFLQDSRAAHQAFERASRAGEGSPDLLLARSNLEDEPKAKLDRINEALAQFNLPKLALTDDTGRPVYDRLTTVAARPKVQNGPKVTVIIAAYDAERTLPTALRSLQEQTWQNLEILVVDDCSPSPGTARVAEEFAAQDSRIRVIRMEENGGAYVARNRALDEATGEYITLHDADDWSHPLKIETQVRFLEANPNVMGCTSQQVRATENLTFPKWSGPHGAIKLCKENVSSFMHRHGPVFERVGYWDSVRFGADSEKMRRIRLAFGEESVTSLPTGPLSFQRISESSIVSDGAFGVNGFFFGARLDYFESQMVKQEQELKYTTPVKNQFAVPQVMRPDRQKLNTHYDVIIASDFRMHGGSTRSSIEEIICQKRAGLRTGLIQMARYDYPVSKRVVPEVRALLEDDICVPVVFGETVSCDVLILRYPPILEHPNRYLPKVEAKEIRVIVNQPPMSDYGPNGERRYMLKNCAENIRRYFGKDATWHPIGPLVRNALIEHHSDELQHVQLADWDWSNIIDVEEWDRGSHHVPMADGKLRIGRHSRDHEHKWPNSAEDIAKIYPESHDTEIHVLGGAKAAQNLLGRLPDNWSVHEFGTLHPREFLRSLDVWIYFSHPDWLESFGRTIIEAMAAGVPVILPEEYKSVFEDAAVYSDQDCAVMVAKSLCEDKMKYKQQILEAQIYVRRKFSYQSHIDRVIPSR